MLLSGTSFVEFGVPSKNVLLKSGSVEPLVNDVLQSLNTLLWSLLLLHAVGREEFARFSGVLFCLDDQIHRRRMFGCRVAAWFNRKNLTVGKSGVLVTVDVHDVARFAGEDHSTGLGVLHEAVVLADTLPYKCSGDVWCCHLLFVY